jgi:tripartite-type tricarboxylate transporter receptor subunit TctC
LCSVSLFANAWEPEKPIRAYSPFTPGSANDIALRITSLAVEKNTKTNFVVETKPGAGGSLLNDFINKQKPDGYEVGALSIPTLGATDKIMMPNKSFTAKDFTYVAAIASVPMTIVALPNDPVNNIKDFARVMKTEKTTIGDPGSAARLVYELCVEYIGFIEGPNNIVRVEYKGPADTLRDVMGGQIRFGIMPLAVSKQAHDAGKVKIIAVTSKNTLSVLPGVQTASSAYPDFVFNLEVVIALPPNTPKDITDWYSTQFNKVLTQKEVVESLEKNMMFINPSLLTSENVTKYVVGYEKRYAPIVDKVISTQK